MIRVFITLACAVILSACGSGDSDTPTLDVNFDAQKGRDSASSLTVVQVESRGEVDINSQINAEISEDESFWVSYTATTTQMVMVKLSSTAEDFELFVYGENYYDEWNSSGIDSNELIFFEAQAGETYGIEVWALLGEGAFTLDIAEPSRSALGLSSNEYVYQLNEQKSIECDDGEFSFSDVSNFVINYQDGYLKYWNVDELISFSSVDDYTVILRESYSESEGEESYSADFNMEFTVNPDTGNISGTEVVDSVGQHESGPYSCRFESRFDGEILM
ncbi:hypothetical protein NBRC116188_22510 [Oceaniserpentilla sp. 4NH20-0058]|uniref:hypothetical protein n=1 Tax=Oceaniserpentilla sp. 4NH20-0058 TaxID=3127660 RepID=UPI0031073E04